MIDNRIFIGLMAIFVTVFGLAYIGINERDRMAEFTEAQHARSIQTGAILFEDNCSTCHGLQGQGILGRAPTINSGDFFESRMDEIEYAGTLESYLELTIAGGRPVKTSTDFTEKMPTWGTEYGGPLREDQIRNVVDFILNWEATATGAATVGAPAATDDPVSRGRNSFNLRGCAGCHAVDGVSSGQVGPNLTNVYAENGEDYVRESILEPNAVIAEGFAEGVMLPNIGAALSPEELDDIVAFLRDASGIEPEPEAEEAQTEETEAEE